MRRTRDDVLASAVARLPSAANCVRAFPTQADLKAAMKRRNCGKQAGRQVVRFGEIWPNCPHESNFADWSALQEPIDDVNLDDAGVVDAGIARVLDEAASAMVQHFCERSDGDKEKCVAYVELGVLALREARDGEHA